MTHRKITALLAALALLAAGPAFAQSSPNFQSGQVLTATGLNTAFTTKQDYSADLSAVASVGTAGLLTRTGPGGWVTRALQGTTGEISVANPDGNSGSPTFSLPTSLTFTGKTVTGGTLSGPTITGATITGASISSSTVSGLTLSSPTITTPSVTGGTYSGGTFNSPTLNTPTVSGLTLTGSTITNATINNPTMSGGTWSSGILNNPTLNSPTITGLSFSGVTISNAAYNGTVSMDTPANWRTAMGLGTAATQNTGTSGATVPLLNTSVTWTGAQAINNNSAGAIVTGLTVANAATWASGQGEEIRIIPSSSGIGVSLRSVAAGASNDADFELYTYSGGVAANSLVVSPSGAWRFPLLTAGTLVTDASGNVTAASAATERTNLGVTATGSDTTYAYRANNLSDLASASTARTNLGLGTAATQNTGTLGATVPLLSNANTWSDIQAIAKSATGAEFVALALRNTAGTNNSGVTIDFDATGAGIGVRSSQIAAITNPSDNGTSLHLRTNAAGTSPADALVISSSEAVRLNAYGAGTLVTDASGNVTAASAATERTNLGLGTIATQNASSVSITGGSISGLTSFANTGDSTLGDANADTTTVNGHLQSVGTAPTVSSCGTGASVGGNSNDNRGSFTTGTGTVNSCVLTFSRAWAVAPFCVISPFQTNPTIEAGLSAFSTTSATFTFNPNGASTAFMYHCEG